MTNPLTSVFRENASLQEGKPFFLPRGKGLAIRKATQPVFQLPTNKGGEGGMEALPGKLQVAEGLPRDIPCVHVENLAVGPLIIPPRDKDMSIYFREGIVEGGKGVTSSRM